MMAGEPTRHDVLPMRRHRALLLALLAIAALWTASARAEEPYRLALLDLETEGVQDPFASELTQRLRAAVSARPEYSLRPTQVSLLQLSIAQDCNIAEA